MANIIITPTLAAQYLILLRARLQALLRISSSKGKIETVGSRGRPGRLQHWGCGQDAGYSYVDASGVGRALFGHHSHAVRGFAAPLLACPGRALRFIKSRLDSGASAADAHRLLTQKLAGEHVPATDVDRAGDSRPLILIAERDSYATGLAEYFLRTEGYHVAIASDATQARLLFDERSPDAVIIDLLLSGGAGFRLCGEFAAKGTAQVLAISAIDSAGEAMRSGAAAFLNKPLDPLVLVSTVRDLLGTSALARPGAAL